MVAAACSRAEANPPRWRTCADGRDSDRCRAAGRRTPASIAKETGHAFNFSAPDPDARRILREPRKCSCPAGSPKNAQLASCSRSRMRRLASGAASVTNPSSTPDAPEVMTATAICADARWKRRRVIPMTSKSSGCGAMTAIRRAAGRGESGTYHGAGPSKSASVTRAPRSWPDAQWHGRTLDDANGLVKSARARTPSAELVAGAGAGSGTAWRVPPSLRRDPS